MRKSLLKLLGVVAVLTLSTYASAIGMGGINVVSALGQPLKADIELVAVNKTEKSSLVARLASPDAYKGAGLEYPYGNKFTFQIDARANGEPYIKASSAQPVNDPFVSLLVELTWASGKLLREYTFLVDPPDYVAEQPKPEEVRTVAPAVQSMPLAPAAKPVEYAIAEAPARVEAKPAEKQAGSAPAKVAEPGAKGVSTGIITVQSGDTLNKIALQHKPAEVSLERMLVALYRANVDEFEAKNMNRINAGKILRMPARVELQNVTQANAVKEIHAQVADWNAYRQKLAVAATPASRTQEAQQVATGKIVSQVADKAPVSKESAKEVLKLSKGEAPGDKVGATGKPQSAQDRKNAEQEDAIAKSKTLKEEQMRAALLEKNIKDMQHLAKLKSEAVALTQSQGLASAPWPTSGVAAASQVNPAPVAKPKPQPVPQPAPQPSFVDQILGQPLYLAGGAAALLGLGGLGYMARRRKHTGGGRNENVGTTTGRIAMPVAPSPETGDFTATPAVYADAARQIEDVDPISEADLFLNFGRDAQAEEILKEALLSTPNNHQIHLKLLGIYANRKDVNSFSAIARKLKDSGDAEAWQQAEAMGRKLEPNNPMYGGAGFDTAMQTIAAMPALDEVLANHESQAPDVDFDLGGEEKTPEMQDEALSAAMDFDVTSSTPTTGLMDFDVSANYPAPTVPLDMDFDVTSTSPVIPEPVVEPETALPSMDDLIFDITSSHPSLPDTQMMAAHAEPHVEPPAGDGGMEFTLDFPLDDIPVKPVAPMAPEAVFGGISLDMGDIASPDKAASETKDERWHEVATKLDLARAYQEMGDATGAREILDEVLSEGDEGQCKAAYLMLDQLG